ncbi:unnamed protein product [Parnassius apollo]|uniref:(apollo) hypothetical protein n=1 Tax=Parnassius apollo TaxID=110799 RepID=A0A8S3W4L5_PARAO|nr:unnamed protein product [Parnassius apollo]
MFLLFTVPNPRTLQIIRNLKQDSISVIQNEIPTTSTSIQFTEKEQSILSPKPNDNIENKDLSNVSEDFCSGDSVKDPDYVDIDTPCSTKRSLLKNKNREVFKNLLSGVDLNEKQYDNFSNDVSTINQTSSPIPIPIAPMQTESSSSSSDGSSSSDSESSSDDELNNERLTAVVQSRVDNNIFPTRATCIEEDISRNDSIEPVASTSRSTPQTSLELTADSTHLGCFFEIIESFWGMEDLQRQREFILRHLSVIQPRYSYKMHNSNRGKNNAFYLTIDIYYIQKQ